MRFLAINLLLLLLLGSCSLKTTQGLRATTISKTEIINAYFSESATDYLYKAKIDVYGRYFGGILIVKKVGAESHRVVFTTEFGSKIFDFLYEGDTFTVNYIVEELNRKILVNTLQKDFKLLISEKIQVNEQFVSDAQQVYKSEANKRDAYYFFSIPENRLDRIVSASKSKEKVEILFNSEEPNIAQQIAIRHHNIKLSINLDYFKKD
jgi:hypothetical protein